MNHRQGKVKFHHLLLVVGTKGANPTNGQFVDGRHGCCLLTIVFVWNVSCGRQQVHSPNSHKLDTNALDASPLVRMLQPAPSLRVIFICLSLFAWFLCVCCFPQAFQQNTKTKSNFMSELVRKQCRRIAWEQCCCEDLSRDVCVKTDGWTDGLGGEGVS